MTPEEIRDLTLEQLRETRLAMMSAPWLIELKKNPEKKTEAADTLLMVNSAILELENAEFASIRDKLEQNEDALTEGAAELKNALQTVGNVGRILEVATKLLGIAARVVTLL
jgi:hypothetical protein